MQVIEKSPVSIEGLRQESTDIDTKFGVLVASIHQSLITRNISKDRLVALLMGFNTLTKVYDGSNQSMFRKQRKQLTDPSATLASVWIIVTEYFSFFDYEILEMITNALGNDEDKQSFAEYKRDFEAYAKRRLFINEVSSEDNPSPNKESSSMFVMLDSSYDDCEIGHFKRLQKKLSSVLGLNEGVLHLCKVQKGSVQLVFIIPDFIPVIIFPLSADQESALQELGVTQLDCGDYHFRAKVCLCDLIMYHKVHIHFDIQEDIVGNCDAEDNTGKTPVLSLSW